MRKKKSWRSCFQIHGSRPTAARSPGHTVPVVHRAPGASTPRQRRRGKDASDFYDGSRAARRKEPTIDRGMAGTFMCFHLILVHFSFMLIQNFCRMAETGQQLIVSNRKARHEYQILEVLEAGIVLKGTEVKSLRKRNANLQDSYAVFKNGELWLLGLHISPYEQGNINNHDPVRTRKLLVQKKEMRKLLSRASEQGLTLVPLSMYFKGPYAKVELAVARGKRSYDKREAIAKRDAQRRISRTLRRNTA